MALIKKKRKPRACVIGLDGVPYSLLLDLAKKGVVPFLGNLIDRGRLHKLKASLPEISAVSWTDFMTGTDSGSHGIFGFTDLRPRSYDIRFPNFLDVRQPTFWDSLGERGKKSIIINQPSTYPARKLNGVLVSGFVAIDLAKAVYPPIHQAALAKMGYQIDIDTLRARDDQAFLWQELERTLAGRKKALDHFWREDWDYFEFVITGTDRLHHFLWNAYGDEKHPGRQNFFDYYRQVDGIVGQIAASFRKLADRDDGLYILSDHGFCGIEQEVYLNAWLEKQGYLKFSVPAPQSLVDLASPSVAFALDPGRIYLNLEKRFPGGSVSASEGTALKGEISLKLEKLEFEGKRVIRRVFDAADVYSGPYLAEGPDLVVLSEYGFDLKGSVKKKEVFGRTNLQGMHTWDDAFFWAYHDAGQDLAIRDLAKIILENY